MTGKERLQKPISFLREEYLTINEAAKALHISTRTVLRYRLEGKLPYVKFSEKKFLFLKKDIESFIADAYEINTDYLS